MGKINLNAREYDLRYTVRDGIELRKRCGRPGVQIMRDLMGLDSTGTLGLTFDLEALAACIVVGIRQEQKILEDTAIKWIQAHLDSGGLIGGLAGPIVEAMNASRCFGFQLRSEEDQGPGKDPVAETSPT
jgi:hypothetical protein